MKTRLQRAAVGIAIAIAADPVFAHVMQTAYNLPVPLWMYAYGATAALVASFVVVGYFVRVDRVGHGIRTFEASTGIARLIGSPRLLTALRWLGGGYFALTVTAGLFGPASPTANANLTFFWVGFVLGFSYLTALVGDVYSRVDPVQWVFDGFEKLAPGLLRERAHYPAWLAYYPAFALYVAFIWLELFGRTSPRTLSMLLIGYTLFALAFAATFGRSAWTRYGDYFAVFLRLVAKIAPVEIFVASNRCEGLRFRLRYPFAGLLDARAEHLSLLLFVLFMLSSTAFDGVHETVPWVGVFWKHIYPVLASFVGTAVAQPYLLLVRTYYWWQWLMLLLSPFVYLLIYSAFIFLAKAITRSPLSVRELGLIFAYSLIPIGFVYHVTHYFTLLLSQGPSILSLLSDPFAMGWNLFETKNMFLDGIFLEAGTIWHIQVWLILIGHVVSVYLSHVEAIRVFGSARRATLSQAPLLLLMVALTTFGLWILSLPIAAGQIMLPPTSSG